MDKGTERTEFAKIIVKLRKDRGDSAKKVAESIGVDYQNYRKYETTVLPKPEIYSKLADYFGVSVDYLMGRKTEHIIPTISSYSEHSGFEYEHTIRQPETKGLSMENNLGELSTLEIIAIKKLRSVSDEDKQDIISYMSSKSDKE